jgi:hypothetical protein
MKSSVQNLVCPKERKKERKKEREGGREGVRKLGRKERRKLGRKEGRPQQPYKVGIIILCFEDKEKTLIN